MKFVPGLSLAALVSTIATRVVSHPSGTASDRTTPFVPLADMVMLDEWFARSQDHTVVLFLHDPGCPISAAAYRQMTRLDGEMALIDVRTGTALTSAIEERTGVRHESPQVLVLVHGQAAWSASHYEITADAVDAARRES